MRVPWRNHFLVVLALSAAPAAAWAEDPKPRHPTARDLVAFAREMVDRGHPDAALAFIEDAIAMEPGNADTYELLGDTYVRVGLYEKAIKAYEKLLTLAPHCSRAVEVTRWLAQRRSAKAG